MPMIKSQVLRCVDFTKTQKSRYLEWNVIFPLNKKKSLIPHQCSNLILTNKKKFFKNANFLEIGVSDHHK